MRKEFGEIRFDVPEGYIDSLKERLAEIPARVSFWDRVKPALYMAAAFAAIVGLGGLLLQKTSTLGLPDDELETYRLAGVLDEVLCVDEELQDGISEEDLVAYMIDNGVSISYIENFIESHEED